MSKKKKGIDLEKVHNVVKKVSLITAILVRSVFTLFGFSVLALFIFAVIRIGQACGIG